MNDKRLRTGNRFQGLAAKYETESLDENCRTMLRSVLAITRNGNDAEVRKNKDGDFSVFEIKKHKVS